MVFNDCQYLESIKIWCGEELESFFISWTDHVPQKSLSLIIVNDDDRSLDANEDNLKIIEKYMKLGVIKRFKVMDFD
ncbi:hypothetical protein C1645_837021 [Glomus cerebriforme]|uniref:F-box associated domain-containing protein n=1 Tax=Glomus cerebriforme TaxID=658196 RepID=A0A397S9F3_9GLOM|nr:hypothetical protein C1645_837021 [Glomus cerebriforme]